MRDSRSAALLAFAVLTLVPLLGRADDWPQWLGPQRDGIWREKGILEKFPASGPKILWRTPIGGGYAGPAIADGKVYVNDRVLGDGIKNPNNPFDKNPLKGQERLLCLDAASGKQLWEHTYDCTYRISYPAGPRTTPSVVDGKVYSIGAMGDLHCVNAADGSLVWKKNFVKDYEAKVPLWGFAGSPLVDGDKVICLVGGKDAVAVAFDRKTGAEVWKSLSLEKGDPGYCPPMIFQLVGRRQLLIWTAEGVNGLDPETGKAIWSYDWPIQAGMSIPTPRQDGDRIFLTAFYAGSVLLEAIKEKPFIKEVWKLKGRSEQPKDTKALHSVMPAPFLRDGFVYGVCSYGELRCLKLADGSRIWSDQRATGYTKPVRWANAFLIPNEDRFFLFNERGDLVIAHLTPKGYEEIDRGHVIDPTGPIGPDRKVVWVHPAFANKVMYVRNDREILAVDLAAK
jgi:outer membrane protein assembly factor BamB